MHGLHLTADLYRCRCEDVWLADPAQLGPWCLQAIDAVQLEPAGHLFQSVPRGVAGTVLLPGSHVCLHTDLGERSASVDVYLAGAGTDPSAKARALMDALLRRFAPEWTEQRSLDRGEP